MSERTIEELRLAARAGIEHMHHAGAQAVDELAERATNAEQQCRNLAARLAILRPKCEVRR